MQLYATAAGAAPSCMLWSCSSALRKVTIDAASTLPLLYLIEQIETPQVSHTSVLVYGRELPSDELAGAKLSLLVKIDHHKTVVRQLPMFWPLSVFQLPGVEPSILHNQIAAWALPCLT